MRLREQVQKEKEELKGMDFNIEPIKVNIQEQAPIGTAKNVCGNCHHRGHRNRPMKPCMLKRCTDFTYCGMKDKQPEYFSKMNSLKLEWRNKEKTISEIESRVTSMEQFSFRMVVNRSTDRQIW